MAQNFNIPDEGDLVSIDSFITEPDQPDSSFREEDLVPIDSFLGTRSESLVEEEPVSFREAMGLDIPEEEVVATEEGPADEKAIPAEVEQPTTEEPEERKAPRIVGTKGLMDVSAIETPDIGPESLTEGLKFTGENIAKGLSGIADIYHWATYSDIDKAIDQKILGKDFSEFGAVSKATEDSIKSFYRYIGEPEEFQEAESVPGVMAEFALQNVGALGPIAFIRQGLIKLGLKGNVVRNMKEGAIDLALDAKAQLDTGVKFFDNFLRNEGILSVVGGVGAGTFWSQGNTEEQKDQLAALGNLAFSLAPAAANLLPSAVAFRTINKVKSDLGDVGSVWDKHDRQVLANLSRLVPEDQLPKLKARIEEIRKIQSIVPDFRPSVGSVIGTSESRQIQALIDTDNFEAASKQYRTNKDAIEKLVREISETTDPAQKEIIASAVRVLREEATFEADRLRSVIGDIQEQILRRSERGLDPDAVGQELKDQYQVALKAYNEHVDSVFKSVDPEGTARFGIEELKTLISAVTVKGGLGEQVNKKHDGYDFLTRELPSFLNSLRSKGAGAESLRAKLGVQTPDQTISYFQLYNLRKALGKESNRIRNANTGSRVPAKLDQIKDEIDNIVVNRLKEGDPEVAERHFQSIDLYRDVFVPRFKKGAAFNILRLDGKDIPNDQVAATLWKASRDDEISNIKQLRDIFEESGLNLKEPNIFNAAKDQVYSLIEDFAVRDLNKKLREATEGGKDIQGAFNKWKRDNATKLKAFPTVQKQIDDIGERVSINSTEIEKHLDVIEDLTGNVINKYSKVSSTELVNKIVNQSPMEVRETFRDLLVRSRLMADFDPELADLRSLDDMINSIPHGAAKREALALRDALSESTVQFLIRRSMRTDGSGFDVDKLLQSLDGADEYVKSESLQLLLNPKNRKELEILRRGTTILGEELTPQAKIELDAMTSFFNKFGLSAPSISARIYAHQLGKVGPVYIVADTLQRTLRGVSKLRAQEIYSRTMYDLEGLEKLIDVRLAANQGDTEALKQLGELSGGLRGVLNSVRRFATDPETYRSKLREALGASTVLKGLRLETYLETVDKVPEEEEGAIDYFLKVNDQDTGQPSRTNEQSAIDRILGTGNTNTLGDLAPTIGEALAVPETPSDIPSEISVESLDTQIEEPIEEGIEVSDDKLSVSNVIKDTFEQSDVSPETGLIIAQIESSLSPSAKATGTSAEGLFQFVDDTWEQMVNRHGSKYGIDLETADKFNPEHNTAMGLEFLKENRASLERRGHETNEFNLYLAHFLGAGGANKFLSSLEEDPTIKASEVVGSRAVKNNPNIFKVKEGNKFGRERTIQEVMDVITDKVNTAREDIQSFLITEEETGQA